MLAPGSISHAAQTPPRIRREISPRLLQRRDQAREARHTGLMSFRLRPGRAAGFVAHVAPRAPAKHPTNCHVAVVCVPGMGPDGSMRAWRRGSTVAAAVLLLSSCGLSFVPPAPAVGNTCVQRTYWTPQCATSAPQGSGAGVAQVGRLWAARREVDMDRGGMMQVLRSSNNEDEVLRAVEGLEKGGALTLKDYTTLLAALKRIKQWKRALDLLATIKSKGLTPNEITYNVVMGACGAAGRWKEALNLFYQMQAAGLPPDAVTFGSLMNAFVRAGLWERALDVMATAKDKGVRLNEGSYTAGLMACEKGGQWALALELLKEMHLVGISPSTFAYNAAIFACRKEKQWVQAIALLGEMRQDGRIADRNSYHGAMATCEEAEKWEAVMDLFEELKQSGIEPSRQSYEYVTRACKEHMYLNRVDDELRDYLKRNNISPNVVENDDREVLQLLQAKLLEQVWKPDDLEDQPTWLSFAQDDDE